jgi:hypothetical protein
MTNTILIEVKNVYGNEALYPVCENGKRFAQIAGKKTLSRADLGIISKLGFEVQFNTKKIDFYA